MQFKVHSKETFYFGLMFTFSFLVYGFLFFPFSLLFLRLDLFLRVWHLYLFKVFIFGGYFGLFALINFLLSLFFMGYLRGNAIKVNERQFSDIFEILKNQSKKLGLSKIPDMYITQGNGILNAFATRFARKNYIFLYSNILEAAYQEGKEAIEFVIGHELGHIKRNHTGFLKSWFTFPARLIPFLGSAYSRACEYTCDNIGYALSPEGAEKGMLVLAVGTLLHQKVNVDEVIINTHREQGFAMWFAEIFSTHPALINRLSKINQLNLDNATQNNIFTSPHVNTPFHENKL